MATTTDYSPVIKEVWSPERVEQMFYKNSPVLANLDRTTDFADLYDHVVVQYGLPQGASHTSSTVLAASQLGVNATKFAKFDVAINEDFAAGTLDDLTLARGKHKPSVLVDAVEKEIGGMIENLSARMSFEVHRDGSAARGRAKSSSAISGTALILSQQSDIYNFEVGMQIQLSDSTTGSLRDSGDYVTITAINPETYTLTADANWSNISGATDSDYLFVRGDAANGSSTVGFKGLGAWNPYGTPSSLWGVTRTTHRDRLAGISYNGSGDSTKKAAMLKLATKMHLAGRGVNSNNRNVKGILHPNDIDSIAIDLQSAVRYVKSESKVAGVYFDGIEIQTSLGLIELLSDPYAPEGYGRIVNFDHFKWKGLDEAPHIVQSDGNRMLRQSAAFGVEFRAVTRGQFVDTAPITLGVALLP